MAGKDEVKERKKRDKKRVKKRRKKEREEREGTLNCKVSLFGATCTRGDILGALGCLLVATSVS